MASGMILRFCTAGLLGCIWLSSTQLQAPLAKDWYQYFGPNRNLISDEKDWKAVWPAEGPKKLWNRAIGIGFSSMSIVDGKVYAMGNEQDTDTIWCLDENTGDVVWKYAYACELFPYMHEGGPGCTPTVADGLVYTVSKDGQMFCLNAQKGDLIWKKNLQEELDVKMPTWRFAVSPLAINNMIIVDVGVTVAFEPKSGNIIWKTEDYTPAYSSAVPMTLNGKACVAVLPAGGLVILDLQTGKQICRYPWETRSGINAASPIIHGNQVFLSSGYNHGASVIEINAEGQPNRIWESKVMRNHINTCVLWNGNVYGFDENILKCIDFNTGEERWRERDLGKGSLMLADGKLIVLSESGELITAEPTPDQFKPISRAQVQSGKCWTVPVLADGKIFSRNAAGNLVCVDVSS